MTFELGLGVGIAVGIIIALLFFIMLGVWKIANNIGSSRKTIDNILKKLEEVQ